MFVDDQTGTLSGSEISKLQAIASPLDVKVLITSKDSRAELDGEVGRMVTSANTLAIGVDPAHHYTFTHFGTGTGISRGDFQSVARAGNGEFHAGNWANGIDAIVASASAASSREAAAHGVVVQPTTVVEHEAPVWPFVLGGLGFVLMFGLFVYWFRRRAARLDAAVDGLDQEAGELRARNIEEQGWHDAFKEKAPQKVGEASPAMKAAIRADVGLPPRQPAYLGGGVRSIPPASAAVPIFVNNQPAAGNDLLTGMLIGEALSSPREVVRERVYEAPRSEPERSSGYSGGSDSSSYDSSPSFDSGSSGGGFDSGGGGGFDGGGGGGDF